MSNDRLLKKSSYFYDLPQELIAQSPVTPRDSSRLLVCRKNGDVSDRGDTTTPNHSSGQSTTGASDFPLGQNILISLAVGFVIAFIATAVMRSKLKSVRPKSGAADYVKEGSFRLTRSNDFFLYRTVSRVAKPKDNGSHRSSSGRSHGGGGGKF